MQIVVGCPIYDRKWILPEWYNKVITESKDIACDLTFVFVYDSRDLGTKEFLWDLIEYPLWMEESCVPGLQKNHQWVAEDFHRMTSLRNQLLRKVRDLAPEYFLSLDSDMLLREGALKAMIDGLSSGFDAVGVNTSMCHQRWCESWMYFSETSNTFARHNEAGDFHGIKEVDAIMGGKLMNHAAYNTDYMWDLQGEDLGWCRNIKKAGLKIGIPYKAQVRHVMYPQDL